MSAAGRALGVIGIVLALVGLFVVDGISAEYSGIIMGAVVGCAAGPPGPDAEHSGRGPLRRLDGHKRRHGPPTMIRGR